MITDLSPLMHKANISLKPEDILLEKGSWVKFSGEFPRDNRTGWCSGKTFIVDQDTVLVHAPFSDNIANQDWVNQDLTDVIGTPPVPGIPHPTVNFSKQLYPINPNILYQIGVGMKMGDYFVQLYIPSGQVPIYQLGSNAMQPSITDPVWRYLGAKYPKDSPEEGPTWFLYTMMNGPQIVMQKFMDGGDTMVGGVLYGKATIVYQVNKCHLNEVKASDYPQSQVPAQSEWSRINARALLIPYYTEITGF